MIQVVVFRIHKPIHVHIKSWPKFVTHPFRINVICNISRNTDHWSYINIFIKFHFNFLNYLFYQFINIIGRFLHALNTFYIFFMRSYLKSSREDPMPKAGGCRGWRITSQWWKKAWSFILLSWRALQKRARRDNFHCLFEGNLHFVFLPSRTLEILQLATETSVIMKTKLKFAEDIDVRPCAELRTSPSAANLFARSTWIRDNS